MWRRLQAVSCSRGSIRVWDLKTGTEIIELLRELNKNEGVTIISATHDYKMVDVSDRVVWIRDGKIAKIEERADIELNVGGMSDRDEH